MAERKRAIDAYIAVDPLGSSVILEFADGTEGFAFYYYPDEITFHPSEFIGMTIEEAAELRTKKDIEYLRS